MVRDTKPRPYIKDGWSPMMSSVYQTLGHEAYCKLHEALGNPLPPNIVNAKKSDK